MKGKLYDIPPAVETLPRNVAKVPAKSRERQANVSMSVNNRLFKELCPGLRRILDFRTVLW